MRYRMKQKAWSLRERFTIQNDLGEDVGYLEKAIMSWGDSLAFYDVRGTQVATIKQKVWSWRPTYEIETAAGVATLEEHRHFLSRPTFAIVAPSYNLGIEGDWTQHEYFVTRDASTIATVSKQWWTWTDTFGVEILPGEDVILILAATVVVDLVHHHEQSR